MLQIAVQPYDHNTFIVQATVATIVNYDRNIFIVHATVATIANYNCNTFIVQATKLSGQKKTGPGLKIGCALMLPGCLA